MGKNDVNQIADNVRVVHAGCGVNALSGLQSRINSMYCSLLVDTDKRSASGSFAFVSSLKRRSYAAFVGINRRMQGSRRIWQTSSLTHPDNSPTDNHAER